MYFEYDKYLYICEIEYSIKIYIYIIFKLIIKVKFSSITSTFPQTNYCPLNELRGNERRNRLPFAEVHSCTQGQSYEHTSLSTKRIRVRKRGRGRGKYVGRAKRTLGHPGGRARGWGGIKGKKWKGRRREDGHRPLTQTNAYVTPREDDLLSIVDSISEASGQLTHPHSPTRRLQGHGSLNMKYAPLIVHGYPPFTIPWRDRFKKWHAKTNSDPGIFHLSYLKV